MLSTVPCSENECVYQNDGMCTLDTAKSPTKNGLKNKACIYFCQNDKVNSNNQGQKP